MMEVQEYWPDIIKEVQEFKKIAAAENPELGLVWQAASDLLDDQFIQTATEKGIARREKLLEIIPFADDTLESRRFRVQTLWIEKLPYTYRVLLNKLDSLCGKDGYAVYLNAGNYALDIKLELTMKRMFNEVSKVTRRMVPANLVLTIELRYNQHNTLARYTHRQLAAFTHDQLRNEVIF